MDAARDGAGQVALVLGVFGLGFGLTVTPRSTAAVESVGRRAFGIASATVTVARMIGMSVGLAVLTAYGSTTIERLFDAVYATSDSYKQFIPEALRNRPLEDGLVVQALESWAAGEAARIMLENRFRHIPIVEDEHTVGIVSIRDVARWSTEEDL